MESAQTLYYITMPLHNGPCQVQEYIQQAITSKVALNTCLEGGILSGNGIFNLRGSSNLTIVGLGSCFTRLTEWKCSNFMCKWALWCAAIHPKVIILLCCRVIPESPRWLLVNGHEEEARAVLVRIAQGNRKPLHARELKKPESESNSRSSSTLDLFRGKNICHRTIVLFCMW